MPFSRRLRNTGRWTLPNLQQIQQVLRTRFCPSGNNPLHGPCLWPMILNSVPLPGLFCGSLTIRSHLPLVNSHYGWRFNIWLWEQDVDKKEASLPKYDGTPYFPATFNTSKMQKRLTKIIFFLGCIMLLTPPSFQSQIKEMLTTGVLFFASASITGLRNGCQSSRWVSHILNYNSPNAFQN